MMPTIRIASIGDEELLAKLNSFGQQPHVQHRPDHFKQTQLPELAAWFKSRLEKPTTRIWIAEEEGRPVGYVVADFKQVPETPLARARDWCEIDEIAVDSALRRRGIGRSLVHKAMAEAQAQGIRRVEAAAWCFNDEAHELFGCLGFGSKTVRFELDLIAPDEAQSKGGFPGRPR